MIFPPKVINKLKSLRGIHVYKIKVYMYINQTKAEGFLFIDKSRRGVKGDTPPTNFLVQRIWPFYFVANF
jgi:hypothetical protein